MNICDVLKELREAEGLSLSQVAEILNITRVAYGRYEAGTRQPSLETLVTLAKFYKVDMNYIFDFK